MLQLLSTFFSGKACMTDKTVVPCDEFSVTDTICLTF